jgi:hypothetical protein
MRKLKTIIKILFALFAFFAAKAVLMFSLRLFSKNNYVHTERVSIIVIEIIRRLDLDFELV